MRRTLFELRRTGARAGLLALMLWAAGCASVRVRESAPAAPPEPAGRAPRVALLGLHNTGAVPYFVETLALGAVYGAGPEMDRLLVRSLSGTFRARGWDVADPVETIRAAGRARRNTRGVWTPEAIRAAAAELKADQVVLGNFCVHGRSVLTFGRRVARLDLQIYEAKDGRPVRELQVRHRDWFFLMMNFKNNDRIAGELAEALGRKWPDAAP